ncbi:MAG TPA: hypothetical protein VE397_20880 [Stellaceae bacterium]|jgi:hypothetical protein|nr:hypothetical protein [Stellaceae bacterium]
MDPKNPATLLVPLIGIALILAAVWLTGGARRARLDPALVLRRLAEDLPAFLPGEVAIDAENMQALVAAADGSAPAIVFAAGDKLVVRLLAPGELRRVALAGDRLLIDTGAFTHGRFALALPGAAARWAALLRAGRSAA